jgi:hypothetical protein
LAEGFFPYVKLNDERMIVGNWISPKTILLNDIVRIESNPAVHIPRRKVALHESSGRTTELYPPDTNQFLNTLSSRLPESVSGRSTGTPPPPTYGPTYRHYEYNGGKRRSDLFSWMSLVYDAKTHTIHPPSDQNAA